MKGSVTKAAVIEVFDEIVAGLLKYSDTNGLEYELTVNVDGQICLMKGDAALGQEQMGFEEAEVFDDVAGLMEFLTAEGALA